MLFSSKEQLTASMNGVAGISDGSFRLENEDKFRGNFLDQLALNSVLNKSREVKALSRYVIRSAARELGIVAPGKNS